MAGTLKALLTLNIAILVAFVLALALSWAFKPALAAQLLPKYGASPNVVQAIIVLQLLAVLGMASAAAVTGCAPRAG